MRVTQGMLSTQMLFDISNNNQRLLQLQNEAATGQKINKPSDDPIGVGFVMQYTQELAYYQQYSDNAQTAQGVLNYTNSVMSEASTVMERAGDLATEGANGTETASDRQDLAEEVGQLYQQLVTIGNSQYDDQYIFNGMQTGSTAAPYPSDDTADTAGGGGQSISVTTDSGQVEYDLGNGVELPVNISGNQFFGGPVESGDTSDNNAFSALANLYNALNNNDTDGINSAITQISDASNNMLAQESYVGALTDRAQLMQNRMSDLSTSVQTQLSNTQGADMATVITNLDTAESVLTASLEIGAKVIQPSLVDYLD